MTANFLYLAFLAARAFFS